MPIIIEEESQLPEPCMDFIQHQHTVNLEVEPTAEVGSNSVDVASTPEFTDFLVAMETLTTVYPDAVPRIPYSQDSNVPYQLDPSKFYPNSRLYIQVGEKWQFKCHFMDHVNKRQFKRHFMDHVNSKMSKMKSSAQNVVLKSCQNQHQRPACFSTRLLRHERPPALSRDHVLISCHV
ncbi:hypothetical protein M8J77_010739 [Diaphorina citri]|nr:hypothetical protein M8J77_010739 [Diaphorina citri]